MSKSVFYADVSRLLDQTYTLIRFVREAVYNWFFFVVCVILFALSGPAHAQEFDWIEAYPSDGWLQQYGFDNIQAGNIFSVENHLNVNGGVYNSGLLHAGGTIENEGYILNNSLIYASGLFRNFGTISGNGVIYVEDASPTLRGKMINESTGILYGGQTINGNFQNNNGRIVIDNPNDIIRVTHEGTALIFGGTIEVNFTPEVGRQYVFLQTDNEGKLNVQSELQGLGSGVPGSVLDVVAKYGHFDGEKYIAGRPWSHLNQYYWLEYERAYSYGAHARTANQIAVGNYIDTISSSPVANSPLWNLLQQLDGISDGYGSGTQAVDAQGNPRFDEWGNPMIVRDNPHYLNTPNAADYSVHQGAINPAALRALDELSGTIYATLGTASANNVGIVNRTMADVLRSDVFKFSHVGNPNNALRGQAIAPLRYSRWGSLFGIGGSTSHDGNAAGYNQSFGGVVAGIDRATWVGLRIGGWFSIAKGDVTMKGLHENTDVTNFLAGVYLRQEMYYGYGLVSGGFGVDTYKTNRNMTMVGHTATSKMDGCIGTAYFERGIDIPIYYATLQPYTSFQFVSVSQDGFREKMRNQYDVRSDVGIVGNKTRTDSYRMALGARASSTPTVTRWGQLALTTNMAWFHEFNDNNSEFVGRFSNTNNSNFSMQYDNARFKIAGNAPKRDWFNFGLGLHMDRNSTRLFLASDLYTNSRQTLYSGGGGVAVSW